MSPLSVVIVALVMWFSCSGLAARRIVAGAYGVATVDLRHRYRIEGAYPLTTAVRLGGDGVHDVHPGRHLAEDRIVAASRCRQVGEDDEELRAVRVRAGVRHRHGAALVGRRSRIVGELVAGPPCPTESPGSARAELASPPWITKPGTSRWKTTPS